MQNITNKKLKEKNKSKEENNKLIIENSKKDRYEFRNELAIFIIERAQGICTEEFIEKAVTQNLKNQKLLMKKMRNVVPNYIKFDWKPYTNKEMSKVITEEDCFDKYYKSGHCIQLYCNYLQKLKIQIGL